MSIEQLRLDDFLTFHAMAATQGEAKPKFKELVEQLEKLPAIQERLVFEMLERTEQMLKSSHEPLLVTTWIAHWSDVISDEKEQKLIGSVEKVTVAYFRCCLQLPMAEPELTLPMLLYIIRRRKPERFLALLDRLERECDATRADRRSQILCEIRKDVEGQ